MGNDDAERRLEIVEGTARPTEGCRLITRFTAHHIEDDDYVKILKRKVNVGCTRKVLGSICTTESRE